MRRVILMRSLLFWGPVQAFQPTHHVSPLSGAKLRAGGTKSEAASGSKSAASSSQLQAWPLDKDPKGMSPEFPLTVARVGMTTAATVLTWYAANYQCGAVLASSAVTLISSLIAPGLGQAAMCGTFAGMSNGGVLVPTVSLSIALGGLTSVLFESLIHRRNMYLGVGGRLGATAFVGVNALALIRGVAVQTITATGLSDAPWLVMSLFGALGSVATIVLREASDDSAAADPVRAAAVIGMLAALLVGFGGFTDVGALAVYGGAFVGMSLPSRLMRGAVPGGMHSSAGGSSDPSIARLLASFAIAGALGGLVHALTLGYGWWVGGWGGKAGFCSFAGVLLYRGLSKTAIGVKSLVSSNKGSAPEPGI